MFQTLESQITLLVVLILQVAIFFLPDDKAGSRRD
jgi:hypothetical protein